MVDFDRHLSGKYKSMCTLCEVQSAAAKEAARAASMQICVECKKQQEMSSFQGETETRWQDTQALATLHVV